MDSAFLDNTDFIYFKPCVWFQLAEFKEKLTSPCKTLSVWHLKDYQICG